MRSLVCNCRYATLLYTWVRYLSVKICHNIFKTWFPIIIATCVSCCRKRSPATRLFILTFFNCNNEADIKAPHYWPYLRKSTGDRWISLIQRQIYRKGCRMSTLWRNVNLPEDCELNTGEYVPPKVIFVLAYLKFNQVVDADDYVLLLENPWGWWILWILNESPKLYVSTIKSFFYAFKQDAIFSKHTHQYTFHSALLKMRYWMSFCKFNIWFSKLKCCRDLWNFAVYWAALYR